MAIRFLVGHSCVLPLEQTGISVADLDINSRQLRIHGFGCFIARTRLSGIHALAKRALIVNTWRITPKPYVHMKMKTPLPKLIIAAICIAASLHQGNMLAQAPLLYAATGFGGSTGELYILNPVDGSVITDVGPLNDSNGNNYGLTGLRYDPSRRLLYGITGSSPTAPNSLVVVNPSNASVTYIGGPFGSRLSDIAIDPFTYIMYAVSGSSKYFYTVNKLTGIATRTGNTTLPPKRGGGFTADAIGVLYGTNDRTLYTYNKITGAATPIGDTHLSYYVDALAFSAAGVLYGIEGGGTTGAGGPAASNRQRWLVVIDPVTGAGVELGETVGNLNALAFVPVP